MEPVASERSAPPKLDKVIRHDELCRILGISRDALYKMRLRGDVPPAVRFGPRSVGWRQSVIDEWWAALEARKTQPAKR